MRSCQGYAGLTPDLRGCVSIDRPGNHQPRIHGDVLGALVLTALTALLHLTGEARSLLPWIVAALVLYLVVFVVTIRVNVPQKTKSKPLVTSTA